MRTRFNPKAIEEMNEFDRYIKDKDTIQKIIKENIGKKIYLEIGMGKGDFITQLCQLDKDNIYIGVEVSPPVLALAIKKLKRYEEENKHLADAPAPGPAHAGTERKDRGRHAYQVNQAHQHLQAGRQHF